MSGHPTAATLHQAARDDDRRRNGPIADDHIRRATDRYYYEDLPRHNTDWMTAKTPAGRPFEITEPPPRADYPTFHDWRKDTFRWRRLRGWASKIRQSTE